MADERNDEWGGDRVRRGHQRYISHEKKKLYSRMFSYKTRGRTMPSEILAERGRRSTCDRVTGGCETKNFPTRSGHDVLYENIRLYSFFSRWLIYPDGRDRTRSSPPFVVPLVSHTKQRRVRSNASTLRAVRSNELSFTQCPARPSLALTCTVPRQNPFPRLLVLVRNVLGVLTPLHVPSMRGRGKIFVSSRVVLSVPIQP